MRAMLTAFCAASVLGLAPPALAQKASAEDIARALTPPPAGETQERTRSMGTRNIRIDPAPASGERPEQASQPRIDLDIEFEFGRAELTPRGRQQLDQLAKGIEMVRTRSARVHVYQLVGHTDAAGGDETNLELSKRRAEAARDYLVATWGIRREHIEVDWRGKRELKNAKDPFAAENRRVEVRRVREAVN